MSCPENAFSLILIDSVKTVGDPLREAESRDELFASTRWTMVLGAGDSATASADAVSALSELCQIYWRPLYAFLRKQGYGPEDAQDLAQGFFADLIKTRTYARADREMARRSQRPVATLRSDVARLRKRYRLILREEVGGTVIETAEVDDELRHLCRVLVVT